MVVAGCVADDASRRPGVVQFPGICGGNPNGGQSNLKRRRVAEPRDGRPDAVAAVYQRPGSPGAGGWVLEIEIGLAMEGAITTETTDLRTVPNNRLGTWLATATG